jgi:predicted DsbA family dithiol-disulfide isomerase
MAQAQISYPLGELAKALKVEPGPTMAYGKSSIKAQTLDGLLYRLEYSGSASDFVSAGYVLEAGLATPQLGQSFVAFLKERQAQFKGKGPQRIGLGQNLSAFGLTLELGSTLSFSLFPLEVQDFGPDRFVLGDKGVMIREFSDFQCPYCKQLSTQLLPQIKKQLIENGRARFSYRHLPLYEIHPQAVPAAEASECAAEQGKFFEYHDALFAKGIEVYNRAREVGLDMTIFQACLGQEQTKKRVQAERDQANRLGLNSTPTVFVGPFKLPNPFDLPTYERYLRMAEALGR